MGKNNYHLKNIKEGTKVESYSIKKFKVGAASVVIGASIFFGAGAVAQASESVSNNTVTDESLGTEKKLEVAPKAQAKPVIENTRESLSAALASKLENSEKETLNKVALTKLIEEIDGKFTDGKYTSKTEESVNQLKAVLEEARTALNNAKTQDELSQAQAKLVTATTKLQTKPEEKKEALAVDTTNGKSTVGVKATNTEKAADTNSIANSGSRDKRNGKVLDKNNSFRTDAAPSTSTSTDPLAKNATNVAIVNGNFNDTSQGAVLPTATSDPITVKNDISKLTGWKPVNSTTTTVPLIWTPKASQYADGFPGDKGSRIGAVLAVYPGRGSASGSPKPEFGPIYQDIDVVGGQEVKVTWRGSTVNINAGNNGAKLVVKNPETGAVLGQYARGYSGTPMGEMSVLVNVPEGLTKLRLQFETALNMSTENHTGDNSYNRPAISSDENAGGVVGNVRVASGSYLVSEVVSTTYESTATSATSATVDTTVTVKVINKGFSTSTNNQYRVELPEGAKLVGTTGTRSAQLNGTSLTLDFNNLDPKREQTLTYTFSLPTTKPIEKQLEGTVSYQTSGNLIDNGTKKTGSDTVAQQTVKINMYKADLQAEAAKAATLNQSDYTPEAWAAYQAEIAKAQEILNEETNNVAIANRKNQADINTQTLLLQKAQAKLEIDKAKKEKLEAIEGTPNATKEEKDAAKQAAQEAATNADKAIDKATDNAGVTTAQTEGTKAVEAVSPTVAAKAAAKAEVAKKLAEKLEAIEGTPNATKEEKDAAKQAAQEAATNADKAIDKATDNAGVTTAQTEGTKAVEAVNPVGKEKAKAAVDAALAEKEKAIEANNKLSDAEKAAAKEEAKKAADEAKKAIEAATDQTGVDAKAAEGKAAVEAVNPVGKEKAKAAVDAALAEKEKAIEANNKLSDAEKAAAKEEAKKAADEAKKAIEAATDQTGVDAKAAEGKAAVAAVNPVGKDKAKEEVEGELAKKLAELENSTDLTDAEKATAKTRVLDEAKKAIEAIEKAMTQAEVDQVIRNFVYHIPAVVLEKEEYDLSKLFVNGSVIVKQGEALADKDILSKLNLPEGVEVVKVEKPETVALGKGTAKVTLKLADGTQVTITVPVEVVEGSTTSGITKLSSEVVKTGETEESSNKVSNKQLPNTGTTETNTGLAGLGLGILGGLLAAARRRKEK